MIFAKRANVENLRNVLLPSTRPGVLLVACIAVSALCGLLGARMQERRLDAFVSGDWRQVDFLRWPTSVVPWRANDEPVVMIGVSMIDSPYSRFHRKLLRLILPPEIALLRFLVPRPTIETLQEPDVLAFDLGLNENVSQTKAWLRYASASMPSSVRAVFKMEADVIYCASSLRNAVLRSHATPLVYYGTYQNEGMCTPIGLEGCPPNHCLWNNTFVGDCWYYMNRDFFGFSTELLRQVLKTSLFQSNASLFRDEGLASGRWVNATSSRSLVKEVRYTCHKQTGVTEMGSSSYENHMMEYISGLSSQKCSVELKLLSQHLGSTVADISQHEKLLA